MAKQLEWYGLLLPNGRALMGYDSAKAALAWVDDIDVSALIRLKFKSRAHMIAFFDQAYG